MRLMFVARSIDRIAGGVERMIVTLMNDLVKRGHKVDLLTWDRSNAESFYAMAPRIKWHRLNMGDPNVRASTPVLLSRARTIRALVRRRNPGAIVCFQDGPFIAVRVYTLGLQIPIIAAERNAPDRFDHISAGRHRRFIYQGLRFATRITIQCESYRAQYPEFLQKRITCIPNPVFPASRKAQPDIPGPNGRFRLLSAGRLSYQKNYGTLIEAFANLAGKFPSWDLTILGEGADRARLEALVSARNLGGRVTLPGTTKSIAEWYASSHLFCLPSRWEGFPNTLAEALAHGLPAVGFADCAGVRDLISHGQSGLLAEGNGDVHKLAITLEKAMSSCELRRCMGRIATESVKRFDPPKIFALWDQLISEVANR